MEKRTIGVGVQHNQPKAVTISDQIVISIAAAIFQPQESARILPERRTRTGSTMEISGKS